MIPNTPQGIAQTIPQMAQISPAVAHGVVRVSTADAGYAYAADAIG
jgi:lipoprotein-anchoring transpeptidase ErfK/SrfK